MAGSKQARNITIVGGTGTVGSAILAALLAQGLHNVSAITRMDSKSEYPASVRVHKGSYDDEAFVASVLEGQDVLVLALGFTAYAAQVPLIRAAATAGVRYVVPTEYGSDPSNEALRAELPFISGRDSYRALVEELAGTNGGSPAWIGVVTNPWLDFNMRTGFLRVDPRARRAELFDGGAVRANLTTVARVGSSLAALLSLPEAELSRHRGSWVYFSSFLVSQRDLLEAAARATTGTSAEGGDWDVTTVDGAAFLRDCRRRRAEGDIMGGAMALFALTFTEGYGGNYNDKVIDYAALGLEPEENLDEVIGKLVAELGAA
ncbi:hypothetical protein BX600DRAFT_504635 [Xylariales sp. PMI_506]|nr:hypothetical protein BX600DRAFT_504635 [Xylariales sp. PMI_506]